MFEIIQIAIWENVIVVLPVEKAFFKSFANQNCYLTWLSTQH